MTIQERRKQKGMTIRDLAKAAGISVGTLSEIETGKRRVTDITAKKLAPVLGVKAFWKLITH